MIRIDIDAEPKPHTIMFDSHGDFLTGEAIRLRAQYSIELLLLGWPGRSSRVLAFPTEHL